MAHRLDQQVAIITGASRGIGRAIAMALLDAGWSVTGLDLAPATLDHPRFEAVAVNLADGAAAAAATLAAAAADL